MCYAFITLYNIFHFVNFVMAIYFDQVTVLMLLFTFVSICRWTMNFSLNFFHGENNNAIYRDSTV